MPEMVRIQNRPLARTGIDYPLSTGPRTFTEEDLQAAVAAVQNDPAVHAPRIKIDGLAKSFDPDAHGGEPALGWVEDLAVSDDGQTLTGTMVVPDWLDEVAEFAYPQLSIEGLSGATTVTGQSHELIVTAVALLGVDLPGISTLPDLAAFLSNGPAGDAPAPEAIKAAASWQGEPLRAGMDQDIVRRRLIDWIESGADDTLPDENESPWDLWPVALRFDDAGKPYAKVLDEGTGRLYRVDIQVSGSEVSFGPFVEVVEQDVPVAAAAGKPTGTVWASRADQRPTPTQEDEGMTPEQIKALRTRLGLTEDQLPDDASPDQITAALSAPVEGDKPDEGKPDGDEAKPDEVPEPIAASTKPPAGTVLVDAAEWESVKAGAQTAKDLAKERAEQEKERTIKAAMSEGRFSPAQRPTYEAMWDESPKLAKHLLTAKAEDGGLAKNTVPVTAMGVEPQEGAAADDGKGTGWFTHETQGQEA